MGILVNPRERFDVVIVLPAFRNYFKVVTAFTPSSLCDKLAGAFEKMP
jgi:hypothetical protein